MTTSIRRLESRVLRVSDAAAVSCLTLVHVKLLASGCRFRERSMFALSAQVTRSDVFASQVSAGRSMRCGPFPSAEDEDPGYPPAEHFCELEVTFDHPEVETTTTRLRSATPAPPLKRSAR
jgi:hypothetical protein